MTRTIRHHGGRLTSQHRPQHLQPAQAPIPLAAWLVPFAVVTVGAFQLRTGQNPRAWYVLAVGFLVLLALAAIGPLQGYSTTERYPVAQRVLLLALFATMTLFSVCCVYVAYAGFDGPLDIWPVFVFLPGWMVFAQFIPLAVDSPAVRMDDPETGWKSIAGYPLTYSNADDAALWVYWRPTLDRVTARVPGMTGLRWGPYAPNLGHHWGRAVMMTAVVLIVATIAMAVVAARPNGLP